MSHLSLRPGFLLLCHLVFIQLFFDISLNSIYPTQHLKSSINNLSFFFVSEPQSQDSNQVQCFFLINVKLIQKIFRYIIFSSCCKPIIHTTLIAARLSFGKERMRSLTCLSSSFIKDVANLGLFPYLLAFLSLHKANTYHRRKYMLPFIRNKIEPYYINYE